MMKEINPKRETRLAAVTGASGHVGANLVRILIDEDWKVRAVVHKDSRALEGLDVEIVNADVMNPESLVASFQGVDVVFNLAASIPFSARGNHQNNEVNYPGAKNVAEACIKSGVGKLIHFSSIHAFCHLPTDEELNENRGSAADDAITYDKTKVQGENAVMEITRQGLDAVIVNPTAILGPFDYKPSPMGEVILSLMEGRMPALVDGGYNWVDVRDVCLGAIAAANYGKKGEKYILSGEYLPFSGLAKFIEESTGRKAPRFKAPMWLAKIGAPFSTAFARASGRRPLYTLESLKILENCNRKISCSKACKELGYSPRPLKTTIADTCRWFNSRGTIKK